MGRIKVFQVVILILAGAIVLRLFYWQFIANVESNNLISHELKIPAERGEILTSDGYPLATNQEAFTLYSKPKEIDSKPEDIAKKISPHFLPEKYSTSEAGFSDEEKNDKEKFLKETEDNLAKKIADDSLFWAQLAKKVTLDKKKKIEDQKIKGLVFQPDTKRYYPEASMSAHILGFVGSDKYGDDTGYFGLEGFYNNQLKGKDGRIGLEKDPFGFPILVGKYRPVEPTKGSSLQTSIDRVIQFVVEDKLRQSVEKYGAKEGTVIVADPKNGNVLAMATYPNYNPNIFSEASGDLYKNPSVGDTYEPGSTFKLVTMAAALDLNLLTPNTKCDICSGPRKISGYEISTWNKKYYPDSTMSEVIQHSDNIGMTFVAQKLGISNFINYIKKFGFSKPTGIDLQEETPGYIRAESDWREIDLATASFGQGIAVTPIQMVQAVSAIANEGKMISPKIVKSIKTEAGEEKAVKKEETQVISPKSAAQMTEMMVNAVEQGEAKAFVPKGYRIAGKTGTAQIPVSGHYDPKKTVASFIGFAPAQNPRFVMLVRFTEPTSSIFGSETAAPTFFSIAKEIFSYYKISPKD